MALWYNDQEEDEEGREEGGWMCKQSLEGGWASNRWARRMRDLREGGRTGEGGREGGRVGRKGRREGGEGKHGLS